jgi:hypothetical protein
LTGNYQAAKGPRLDSWFEKLKQAYARLPK